MVISTGVEISTSVVLVSEISAGAAVDISTRVGISIGASVVYSTGVGILTGTVGMRIGAARMVLVFSITEALGVLASITFSNEPSSLRSAVCSLPFKNFRVNLFCTSSVLFLMYS